MHKILWLALLTTLFGCSRQQGDLTVVGHLYENALAQSMDFTLMFKDVRTRIHTDASFGESTVIGFKTGEMVLLMPPLKSYSKISSHMFQAPFDSGKQAPGVPKDGVIALMPTGKKATINGYPADEYIDTVDGEKTILWLTKAVPNYTDALKKLSKLLGATGTPAPSPDLDWSALPGFPMRIIKEHKPGGPDTIDVLSISNKPIPDSEFAIPAGYKEDKFGIDAPN